MEDAGSAVLCAALHHHPKPAVLRTWPKHVALPSCSPPPCTHQGENVPEGAKQKNVFNLQPSCMSHSSFPPGSISHPCHGSGCRNDALLAARPKQMGPSSSWPCCLGFDPLPALEAGPGIPCCKATLGKSQTNPYLPHSNISFQMKRATHDFTQRGGVKENRDAISSAVALINQQG